MATLASLNPLAALGLGGEQQPAAAPSYDELLRRRAMAVALAGRRDKGFPKTFGEGLTYLGESVGERLNDNDLRKKEAAFAAAEDAKLGTARGVAPTYGGGGAPRAAPVAAAPVAAPVAAPAAAPAGNTFGGQPYTEVPVRKSEGEELKDKLAALLLGNGAGVPQENPTEAEALSPPQEAGGPQPNVQLASLGGAGGTMTDAPPPGAGVPAPPVSDAPEPTPTDIKPMPVQTAQVGAPPSGVLPGSDASMFASPAFRPMQAPAARDISQGIKPAPDGAPSTTPIPSATEQVMKHPGPPPTPPRQLPLSPRQQGWLEIMQSRNASTHAKEVAKAQFDTEEKFRTDMQSRQDADYTNRRARWESKTDEYEKFEREAETRKITQLNARLAAEDAQHKLKVVAPLEAAIKRAEVARLPDVAEQLRGQLRAQNDAHEQAKASLEESVYKVTQRPANERAQQATTQSTERNVATPHRLQLKGTEFISPYIPESRTFGPLTVAPGAPAPEEKAPNETEAKAIAFYERVRDDLTNVKTKMGGGKALTDHIEHAKWNAPMVPESIRNSMISNEYRAAKDALGNWGAAFLHNVSGATVTPAEALIQLPAFVPRPGDTAEDIADKARRRDAFTEAARKISGEPGRRMLERAASEENKTYVFNKNAEKPDVRVNSPEEAAKLEPGQWFITHDGKRKQRGSP